METTRVWLRLCVHADRGIKERPEARGGAREAQGRGDAQVISLMFVYINARVRLGSREEKTRVRSEVATIETLNFRFRSKAREDNYTEQMACNLTRYPRELVLCGPDLYFDPIDFDALDALMDECFTPENLRIHLVAPTAEMPGVGDTAKWEAGCEKEKWYGTVFSREPVLTPPSPPTPLPYLATPSAPCTLGAHASTPRPHPPTLATAPRRAAACSRAHRQPRTPHPFSIRPSQTSPPNPSAASAPLGNPKSKTRNLGRDGGLTRRWVGLGGRWRQRGWPSGAIRPALATPNSSSRTPTRTCPTRSRSRGRPRPHSRP